MKTFAILILMLFTSYGNSYGQRQVLERQDIENLTRTDIVTVTYCEVIQHPSLYNQKIIRIHGVYEHWWEYSYFADLTCLPEQSSEAKARARSQMWIDLDPAYKTQTEAGVLKVFEQFMRYQSEMEAVFVGKFYGADEGGHYGHLGGARFLLLVGRVEQVKPIKSKAPNNSTAMPNNSFNRSAR